MGAVWEKPFKSEWEKRFSEEHSCTIKVALYASNVETKFEKEILNKECLLLLNFDAKYLSACMIICVDLKILFYASVNNQHGLGLGGTTDAHRDVPIS